MTEQSRSDRLNRASNEILDATSFLSGTNAAFIEGLYAQYLADPNSVDPSWRSYFADLGEQGLNATQLGRGPAWQRDRKPATPKDELTQALSGEAVAPKPAPSKAAPQAGAAQPGADRASAQDSIHAIQLVRAYRVIGHLEADLDPLKISPRVPHQQLDPAFYGFDEAKMDKPVFIAGVLGMDSATPRQMVDLLKRTYCGRIGYEFMHINDAEQKDWLQRRIEGEGKEISFTPEGKKAILNKLIEAEGFEKFASNRFVGTKRFGLDGGEATIPALEQIIKRGGQLGVKEIV